MNQVLKLFIIFTILVFLSGFITGKIYGSETEQNRYVKFLEQHALENNTCKANLIHPLKECAFTINNNQTYILYKINYAIPKRNP